MRFALLLALTVPAIALRDEPLVPKGAKLELLFTRSAPLMGGLTEGPACAADGSIYFSDIPVGKDKGMILRFDPKTKKTNVFTDDSHKSNGLKFDGKGNLIACEGSDEGGRAVVSWDLKTKKRTVLADRYKGHRFNAPNDLVIDAKGRIYFSDPRYLGDEPRELAHRAVYRIDPASKEVVEVTHDIEKPNGIALSPGRQDALRRRPQQRHRQDRSEGSGPETRRHEDLRLSAGSRRASRRKTANAGRLQGRHRLRRHVRRCQGPRLPDGSRPETTRPHGR